MKVPCLKDPEGEVSVETSKMVSVRTPTVAKTEGGEGRREREGEREEKRKRERRGGGRRRERED